MKWHFLAVALFKKTATTTTVCILYDTDGYSCSATVMTTVYSDTGTNNIRVGSGFKGMIRTFQVYDHPKLFSTQYQILSSLKCYTFNSVACPVCDLNFYKECFSNCEVNQYADGCYSCNSNCLSCYSNSIFTCFKCPSSTHSFFSADTYCKEVCGDGKKFGAYECDDGNTVSGDGCSSTCYIEKGWQCSGGSPTT